MCFYLFSKPYYFMLLYLVLALCVISFNSSCIISLLMYYCCWGGRVLFPVVVLFIRYGALPGNEIHNYQFIYV